MQLRAWLAVIFALSTLLPDNSLATVMGAADMTLSLPSAGAITSNYNYSNRLYASLYDGMLTPNRVEAYLDASTYKDETSFSASKVIGSYDRSTGNQAFSFETNSTDPTGYYYGNVSVDMFASTYFTGVLSNFSFDYNFNGSKDNPNDILWLTIQMQIAYLDEATNKWLNVYSDYTSANFSPDLDGTAIWRSKMTKILDDTTDSLILSDTVTYDDYSSYGTKKWWLRYDFQGGGADLAGITETAPIPEPSTMLLLGTGLVGLFAYRRQKKI